MNNDTLNQKQDSIPCKKPYEMPMIDMYSIDYNDVINTSDPTKDRGQWDVNKP